MAGIYKSTWDFIGNTPLMEAVGLEKTHQLEARILMKLEYLNPAGSIKDRAAKVYDSGRRRKRNLEKGKRHRRAYFRKYGHWPGVPCRFQRVSCYFDYAGNNES